MLKKRMFSLFSLFFLLSIAHATTVDTHIVIAPHCLLKNVHANYHTLFSSSMLSLIEVNHYDIPKIIAAKHKNKKLCGGFMDVSNAWKEFNKKNNIIANPAQVFLTNYEKPPFPFPNIKPIYSIKYEKQVHEMLNQLNPDHMWTKLTWFTHYKDRYANSDYGVAAANWLKDEVENIARENNRNDVTVYFIPTGDEYKQSSVIVKIGNSLEPGIVIGGHMDTLSSTKTDKPGADDDGTGSVTVLEIARTLISSKMNFKKPIYLLWYAAEEEGLVGSAYVVSEFKNKKIPIDAVIHFDLTGYAYKNEKTMWLISDYVDQDLTAYLEKLISTYVKQPVKYTRCGYACSDHASWTQNGYAASIPAEAAFQNTNPHIHSSRDTIDKLSLKHMTDYVKLGTAFAVELAEPI